MVRFILGRSRLCQVPAAHPCKTLVCQNLEEPVAFQTPAPKARREMFQYHDSHSTKKTRCQAGQVVTEIPRPANSALAASQPTAARQSSPITVASHVFDHVCLVVAGERHGPSGGWWLCGWLCWHNHWTPHHMGMCIIVVGNSTQKHAPNKQRSSSS